MGTDKYDTWAKWHSASKMNHKLTLMMCNIKPGKNDSDELKVIWEADMQEVRNWSIAIGQRGDDLNLRKLAEWRTKNNK